MEESKDNKFRYCSKCGNRMTQTHIRVDKDIIIRTRKCLVCNTKGLHTVELPVETYNNVVKKYNQIIELVKDTSN